MFVPHSLHSHFLSLALLINLCCAQFLFHILNLPHVFFPFYFILNLLNKTFVICIYKYFMYGQDVPRRSACTSRRACMWKWVPSLSNNIGSSACKQSDLITLWMVYGWRHVVPVVLLLFSILPPPQPFNPLLLYQNTSPWRAKEGELFCPFPRLIIFPWLHI